VPSLGTLLGKAAIAYETGKDKEVVMSQEEKFVWAFLLVALFLMLGYGVYAINTDFLKLQ
jgi:hypothetical protein